MDKIIRQLYHRVEHYNYSITVNIIEKSNCLYYQLIYQNENTGVSFTEDDPDKYELIRKSNLPVWAKEKIFADGFLK